MYLMYPIYLSIYLPIYLSTYLPTYLPIYLMYLMYLMYLIYLIYHRVYWWCSQLPTGHFGGHGHGEVWSSRRPWSWLPRSWWRLWTRPHQPQRDWNSALFLGRSGKGWRNRMELDFYLDFLHDALMFGWCLRVGLGGQRADFLCGLTCFFMFFSIH